MTDPIQNAIDVLKRAPELVQEYAKSGNEADVAMLVLDEFANAREGLERYAELEAWRHRNFVQIQRDCNRGAS